MKNIRIPTNFDLPTKYSDGPHHVPHKARDPETIARRRARPAGSLIVRQQQQGLFIGTSVLKHTKTPQGASFAREIVGTSLLGSAWHSYAQDSEVMRRCLKLPMLAEYDPDQRPNTNELTSQAINQLDEAMVCSQSLVFAVESRRAQPFDRYHRQLGRQLGNASLTLAGAEVGDTVAHMPWLSPLEVQTVMRQRGLALLERTRTLGQELSVTPSLALLAEPDGPLAVHTRIHAPNDVYRAYTSALEEYSDVA